MPFRSRSIARELSAAFAVAIIYMLVLLAPLHQAAGLQRDLATLGYVTTQWSICTPIAEDADSQAVVVKCAAAGIAKHELADAAPVPMALGVVRLASLVAYPGFEAGNAQAVPRHVGQARAPPQAG